MKSLLVVVVGLLIFCRCSTDSQKYIDVSYSVKEQVDLSVNKVDYNIKLQSAYHLEGRLLLYFLNASNQLVCYDWESQSLHLIVEYPYMGPQGFGEITDFLVLSEDSILVYNEREYLLYLTNDKAEILKRWDFKPYSSTSMIAFTSDKEFRMAFKKDLVYLQTYPAIDPDDRDFYKEKFLAQIDLSNGSLDHLVNFPQYYLEQEYSPVELYPSFSLFKGDSFLISYPLDHSFYLYHGHGEVVNKWEAGSKYLPNDFKRMGSVGTLEEDGEYIIAEPFYYTHLYDPYFDRIYRIVKHGQDRVQDQELKYSNSPWSIIVLTGDGEYIGEALFPASRYDFNSILVTPVGLLISKEVETNLDNREDYLEYDLIELDI